MSELGARWRETPLHWAALCSIEAMEFLLHEDPDLLYIKDAEDRTALDWVVEKIYFLKEELGVNQNESSHFYGMLSAAVNCGLYLLNHVERIGGEECLCSSGSRVRLMQYALGSGESVIVHKISQVFPGTPPAVWMSGLVGLWSSKMDVDVYKRLMDEVAQLERRGYWNQRPMGLVVAQLWASGKITTARSLWFHQAGWRLDDETEDESIEVFCSQVKGFDMAKLDRLLEAL
jgi:hypothetical protein